MHENPILAEVLDEHVLDSVWGLDGDAEDLADRIGIRPELEAAAVLYDAEVDRAEVYDRTTWRNRLHQEWQELGPVNYILKWGAISVAASAAIVGTVATGGSTFVAGGGLKAFLGNAVVGFAIDTGIAAGATVVGYGAQETAELLAAREGRRVTGGQSPGEMFAAFQTVTAPVAIGKTLLRPTREFGKTFIKATTDTATRARSFARGLAQLASDPAGAALERGRSAVATLTDLARRAAARGDATTARRLGDAATDVQRAEGNLARIEGRQAAIEALEGRGTGPQVAVPGVPSGRATMTGGRGVAAPEGARAAVPGAVEPPQFLYRAITPEESLVGGLRPMGPELRAGPLARGPLEHVHGVKPSEWISLTKDLEYAKARAARSGGSVIEVDMRLAQGEVLDLSRGWRGNPSLMDRLRSLGATERQLRSTRLHDFSTGQSEVLLKGFVSPEGIFGVQ